MSNLSNSRRRRCRHVDWYTFPDAGINSCWECGLTFQTAGFTPPEIVYSAQPQPENSSLQDEETLQAIRRPSTHYFPPLNPNRQGEIRVLDLKPGEQNDRLRCHLKTVNLAFGVVYEAVSYTWADNSGNDDLCSTIYALGTQDRPGGDIAITRNCEAMLRRLRHPHKTRRLWVDAICIDQLNIRERNHQVQAMTAIFRGAQRVVVYLGEAEPVVDRLVEYITEDQGGHLPALLDFLPLFRTRWFHRVWVLQEIAVARSALLVLERRSLDWQELVINARVFLRLVNEQRQYIPLPPVLAFGLQSTSNGPSAANLQTVDFLSIMRVSRDCSCKDPRDKIYAVLGLADTDSRPPLEADYSSNASPRPVYSRFAVWHVSRTLTPRILEHVEGLSRLAASAMPTWVPDWTNAGPQSPLPSLPKTGAPLPPAIIQLADTAMLKSLEENGSLQRVMDVQTAIASTKKLDAMPEIDDNNAESYAEILRVWEEDKRARKVLERLSLGCVDLRSDYPVLRLRGWRAGHVQYLRMMSTRLIARNASPKGILDATLTEESGLSFWEAIWLLSRGKADPMDPHLIPGRRLIAELTQPVPIAFGGPCGDCNVPSNKDRWKEYFHSDLQDFLYQLQLYGGGRRMFITEYSLGFGHPDMTPSDEIWILDNVQVPLILRPTSDDIHAPERRPHVLYRVIGSCYVYAVTRLVDKCLWCVNSHERRRIYSAIQQEEESFVQVGSNAHQWKQTLEIV